jgi:hypothetical protein
MGTDGNTMGTGGNLEQIERIQSSIDKSLARVKYGLSVQSTNLSTQNALTPTPASVVNATSNATITSNPRTGTTSKNLWGENSDTPVNRLMKLHRDMATIRTTAQVFVHDF